MLGPRHKPQNHTTIIGVIEEVCELSLLPAYKLSLGSPSKSTSNKRSTRIKRQSSKETGTGLERSMESGDVYVGKMENVDRKGFFVGKGYSE